LAIVNAVLYRFNKEFAILKWIQDLFGFNLLIQVLQFGFIYFVIATSSPTTYKATSVKIGITNHGLQTFHYYCAFAFITMYPIGIVVFLTLIGKNGLQDKRLRAKFGSLYGGIDLDAWKHNVHYISFFLVRRAVLGLSIAFLRNYLFLQLELYMLTTLACLGFLVTVTPYEATLNNVLEIINELVVIMTIYILHTFSIVTNPG
jgi:hypothetical protein